MKKILVIEDEELVRLSLADVLEAEDFEVVLAENGTIGIGLANKEEPDLILCDIMMPQVDGYGVLASLQQNPITTTIPFIFLTAKTENSDLRQGMQLGADDYLTKPFTRDDLLKAIKTRLTKQSIINSQMHNKIDVLRQHLIQPLSNDFLAPLKAIKFSAELLRQPGEIDQPHLNEIADGLDWAADRVQRLIQNFLFYAELEATTTDPQHLIAFRDANTTNAETLRQVVTDKAKTFRREADLSLGLQDARIKMSDLHFQKVVEELVDNAFRYSPPGTPVRIMSLVKNSRYVLYVTDNGRGLNTGQINSLNPYNFYERKLPEQSGAGLGLAITKRLVELYGGELYFDTIRGHKTMVRVVLPCKIRAAAIR